MTSRKAAARHERDEYFRLLTESVIDIVAIVGGDGTLTYVSPAVERCLGYVPQDLIGRDSMDIVHFEDRERVQAQLASCAGRPNIPYTYRLSHKDGSLRFVESVARDLRDHPLIGGIVVNTRDVTERLRLEREVAQLNRLTGLGRLAAQVAHEFNNVLMGIQPFIGVIRKRTTGDAHLARITDLMTASVERGRRITHDILRFSRPAEPSFTLVDVQDLLQAAAEEIRHRLPAIRLQVVVPREPMSIVADRGQITQVLINLATNSNDAMGARGGTLTIAAAGRDKSAPFRTLLDAQPFVHFTVSDTGEGIAPENLEHVFEPMFTTKQTGTGLGLSVVQQVVALHNGHVFVESTRGQGTSMHLFLPRGAAEPGGERAEAPQYATPPLRVLIVEDDAMVAEGIIAALGGESMVVRAVHTGKDALAVVDEFRPDLMLLDVRLPDGDGRDVYDRIAERRPDLPVIFSTGQAMERELERYLRRPNVGYLLKPYPVDELMKTILQVISSAAR
jgi:PAS domain S-box-containing protein